MNKSSQHESLNIVAKSTNFVNMCVSKYWITEEARYHPRIVHAHKVWLAQRVMPIGSLRCFLDRGTADVLVLWIIFTCDMICVMDASRHRSVARPIVYNLSYNYPWVDESRWVYINIVISLNFFLDGGGTGGVRAWVMFFEYLSNGL